MGFRYDGIFYSLGGRVCVTMWALLGLCFYFKGFIMSEEYKTPCIEIEHEDCGGLIEIDYQCGVRNYESYCEKCNKNLFITIDFNVRVIED